MNQGNLDAVTLAQREHGIKCGTFGASPLEDRHHRNEETMQAAGGI